MAAVIMAMALGVGAVCLPAYFQGLPPRTAPLFPWVSTGVEGLGITNLVLLFVAGITLGVLFCRRGTAIRHPPEPGDYPDLREVLEIIKPLLLGMATMALFPLFAFAETIADPTSHNLWPFELVMYFLLGLVAVVGAYVGRFAMRGLGTR